MDGGYAEVMIAQARAIASIPDELSSVEAAPSYALALRLTTLSATPACAAEIWWLCKALAA